MLGLEFAIRGTQEQKMDVLSPAPSPKHASSSSVQPQDVTNSSSSSTHSSSGSSSASTTVPNYHFGIERQDSASSLGAVVGGDSTQGSVQNSLNSLSSASLATFYQHQHGSISGSSTTSINGNSLKGAPPYLARLKAELNKACTKEVFRIPTSDGSRCRITSYGADKFREVRQSCGIEDDDFLLSVGIRQVIGSLLLGDLVGLSEQVSEGKSGSFFYWSQDGRYMVKTFSRAENYQMRKIMHSYHEHMTAHPDNLLMRILGLFRLKINADSWDLIILENVFTTNHGIHERFDLKGSTYERTVGVRHRCQPGVVMKDRDFLELGRSIHVGPELGEKLKQQIAVDTQFLARNDIIDYSFLVGVHYVDRGIPEDIWVAQQSEQLERMYQEFQDLAAEYPFFKKDMDLAAFCHYAYNHHHFDKEDSLSLLAATSLASPKSLGGGGPGGAGKGGGGGGEVILNARQGIRAYRTEQDQRDGEPDQILFFGIIDILVPFDSRKRGEYVLKSLVQKDFSVIPPRDYRQRFMRFVGNAVR